MVGDIGSSNEATRDLPIALKVPLAAMDSKIAKNTHEVLVGHFPDLNKKELTICDIMNSSGN